MDETTPVVPIPLHFSVVIHLINLHDKFNKMFASWSFQTTPDKDTLTVILKESVSIDTTLFDLIQLQYPGRIKGPYIKKNTLVLDFVKNSEINKEKSIAHIIERPRKRPRKNEEEKSQDTNVAAIQQLLLREIRKCNSINTDLATPIHGHDTSGDWILFNILYADTINTCFIQAVKADKLLMNVKVFFTFVSSCSCRL